MVGRAGCGGRHRPVDWAALDLKVMVDSKSDSDPLFVLEASPVGVPINMHSLSYWEAVVTLRFTFRGLL